VVCNVEKLPGGGAWFCRAAGSSATVTKKVGDRVVLKMPNKAEFSFDERSMAVVGESPLIFISSSFFPCLELNLFMLSHVHDDEDIFSNL
jgi:hypothetical protein